MSQHDSSDKSHVIPESTYPELQTPTFKSQIPEYLMSDASAPEKYIMEQLSVLTQTSEWSTKAHLSTMQSVRKTNGRLIRAESDIKELQDDRRVLLQGWRLIVAIGMGVSGFLAFAIQLYKTFSGH
jgi:hypothetical protein